MVDEILLWKPILWTLRVALLILLLGTAWCSFLYFLRFSRWKHVVAMWNAEMPRITEVGGQQFGVKLDHKQDTQLAALGADVEEVRRVQKLHRNALQVLTGHITRKEGDDEP